AVGGRGRVVRGEPFFLGRPFGVQVEKIRAGRVPPRAGRGGFDGAPLQRTLEQRVVLKIDLSNRKIFGGPPIGVHFLQQLGRKRVRHARAPQRDSRDNQPRGGKVRAPRRPTGEGGTSFEPGH